MWSFFWHPNYYRIKFKSFFFSASIRMSEKSIVFNNKNVKKSNFYKSKKLFKIDDIDANKILVSRKDQYGAYKLVKMIVMALEHYV